MATGSLATAALGGGCSLGGALLGGGCSSVVAALRWRLLFGGGCSLVAAARFTLAQVAAHRHGNECVIAGGRWRVLTN